MSVNSPSMKIFFLSLFFCYYLALAQQNENFVSEKFFVCGAGIQHEKINPEFPGGIDFISFSYEDLKIPEHHPFRMRSESIQTHQGLSSFQVSSPIIWNTQATNISVHLSTESYGASYFLDLCYIQTTNDITSAHGYYSLKSEVQLPGSKNYRLNSKLTVQAQVKCKLSDSMSQNIAPQTDSSTPMDFNFSYETYPVGTQDGSIQWKIPINLDQRHFPQACQVRIYFYELASAQRKHVLEIQDIETHTTIDKDSYDFLD